MSRYEGKRPQSDAPSHFNLCFPFSMGETLFLDVPGSNFLGRGDLELRGPLAQSYGAKVKTFCAEISFEIILKI